MRNPGEKPESRANFAARAARLAVLPDAHMPALCWSRLLDARAPAAKSAASRTEAVTRDGDDRRRCLAARASSCAVPVR